MTDPSEHLSDPAWKNPEFRQGYMEASITQGVAWQIRINREARGWSPAELAKHAGLEASTIAIYEDTEVDLGALSLGVLSQIAHAFGVVLRVDFTSYATLAQSSEHLTEADLYVPPVAFD